MDTIVVCSCTVVILHFGDVYVPVSRRC
ncbi:hypothetical protein P4S64_03550 [Vibrio sp. M60_M31a]